MSELMTKNKTDNYQAAMTLERIVTGKKPSKEDHIKQYIKHVGVKKIEEHKSGIKKRNR